jgi:hemin uptake protein HemP
MTSDRDAPAEAPAGREPVADALPAGPEQVGVTPRVVTSESLLGGATQLAILHDRTFYFLRQTRYGKLILTK